MTMSVSIHSYGVAFPSLRLPVAALAGAWGSGAGRGLQRKPFCAYDEDAISLAIAAARSALAGQDKIIKDIHALFVGSTTLPYEEKPASATILTAAIGHPNIRTVEVRGSCQAGLQALVSAREYCSVHPGSFALAIAADAPQASPSAALEHYLSGAAAAFLIGSGHGLVRFGSSSAVTIETFGSRHRRAGERYISDLELRSTDSTKAVQLMGSQFKPGAVHRLAMGAAPELMNAVGRVFGGVADGLWPYLGDAGAASAPVALAHALENAAADENILAMAIGSGAIALTLARNGSWLPLRPSVMTELMSGNEVDYLTYLKHRRLIGATEVSAG